MTAFLVLTEAEPILVMAPRAEVEGNSLVNDLSRVGIKRFIAHEVAVDELREAYGRTFEVIEADVKSGKGLRVLDSNGDQALSHVQLAHLGPAVAHGLSPRA
jgi:hypothetical protein